MKQRGGLRHLSRARCVSWLTAAWFSIAAAAAQESGAPVRILLDQPPRAVEYQLGRLTNEELAHIERKDDDAKYRLVYVALLTRKGLARELRDEAVAALTKIDHLSPTQVLLEALARIPADDGPTGDKLAMMLLGEPVETLRSQRGVLAQAAGVAEVSPALRAAHMALMIADDSPDAAWQLAGQHAGHLVELLRGVPLLPADVALDPLRARVASAITALLTERRDAASRAQALEALAWTRRDASTFQLLARELLGPQAGLTTATRAAAVRALQRIPESAWTAAEIEPLARAMVALVRDTPTNQRTEPAAVEAIQLGERLAASLPDEARTAVRRDLRALGVQVVGIETLPEQMQFTVKWFVVEHGKPVQIVFFNPDTMPHNLVLGEPGALEKLGTAAMTMQMPSDPAVKPYVPAGPLVVQATNLVKEGETERLNFTAPEEAGEYVYACTFPGHWVRMYGVMLVVDNLEAWEAAPTTPADPITGRPFSSRR